MPEISSGLATLFVLLILVILTAVIFAVSRARSRKRLKERLIRTFGERPNPDRTEEEYESMAEFAASRAGNRFYLDDTTWNDLSMDAVFRRINSAVSSPGEDVLYAMLRIPSFDEQELAERETLIRYFDTHEKERLDMQMTLAGVGKRRGMSHFALIRRLEDAKPVNTLLYAGLLFLALLTIALFFIRPAVGVILLIPLIVVNVNLQLKNNERIRFEVLAFKALLQLLAASERIRKMDIPMPDEDREILGNSLKAFSSFRKGSYFVTSAASVADSPADAVFEYLKLFFHIDMLKFNQMLNGYRKNKDLASEMLRVLGTLDAAAAVASFRRTLPYYSLPSFEKGEEAFLHAEEIYHPLIDEPVTNDADMRGGNLVTGANATGKSTFLKNTALLAVLAQSIGTVPAKNYRAPFFKVMSSMALTDDLSGGDSYFIVELKSVRRILEEADRDGALLCLIDEVLRGTNTIERIAASGRILRSLIRPNVLAFAATHDIELTGILGNSYTNWHFSEEVKDGEVLFDYKLKAGPAVSRNAIKLLGVMDFPAEIVAGAQCDAERFEESGVWTVL